MKDELIDRRFENLEHQVRELESKREFQDAQNRITDIEERVDQLQERTDTLTIKLSNNFKKSTELNEYTDDDIKNLYINSELVCKQVADKFSVSIQMANKYVNGKIEDKGTRSRLVAYFLEEISKHDKENI